jgi:predicted nuclease of predicted toxin-antitoxin system
MTGQSISVLTDEMITPRLADSLRLQGYDAASCHALGRANQSISDADQLRFAAAEGRAIYTFNAIDFRRLHALWQTTGDEHAGIIISEDLNKDPAEMSRRLQRHLDTVDATMQHNRIWVLES